jgi:hypothetical protein
MNAMSVCLFYAPHHSSRYFSLIAAFSLFFLSLASKSKIFILKEKTSSTYLLNYVACLLAFFTRVYFMALGKSLCESSLHYLRVRVCV